ncbi:hypothetical protein CBOM_05443 [Ceraceosorus bombacis]|uniref:Uncharacterized protein n=1 Tax=Ceraceosorus bombacis TaxID=401625 RepID=A0A0P1BS19_9BASI|nr:hypothetical protein CBOM_05443 [Ceraceosorus bombacis]
MYAAVLSAAAPRDRGGPARGWHRIRVQRELELEGRLGRGAFTAQHCTHDFINYHR